MSFKKGDALLYVPPIDKRKQFGIIRSRYHDHKTNTTEYTIELEDTRIVSVIGLEYIILITDDNKGSHIYYTKPFRVEVISVDHTSFPSRFVVKYVNHPHKMNSYVDTIEKYLCDIDFWNEI